MKHRPILAGLSLLLLLSLFLTPVAKVSAYSDITTEQLVRQFVEANQTQELDLRVAADAPNIFTISGSLEGAQFIIKLPPSWNKQFVLYAHGYVTPDTQNGLDVSRFTPEATGILASALAEGYGIAYSAYGKTGYAVENGIKSTQALKNLVATLGAQRFYVVGVSMGGNVTMGLVEKYPQDYAGAITYCGVVAGWYDEIRYLTDFRLVYDYFTKPFGEPIALPGAGDSQTPNPFYTLAAVSTSVVTLFSQAATRPELASAIRQISKITNANPDIISYVTALASSTYGSGDLLETAGGFPYTNADKRYSGSDNDDALNAGIERIKASQTATDYLNTWYSPQGNFQAKVLSVHNLIDPLVPYEQEPILKARVVAQNNTVRYVQQVVDANPVNPTNPVAGGPTHCFFTTAQFAFAWNELREWTDLNVRPQDDINITKK